MAKELILVVDDEEDILELLIFNLKTEKFNVISATSGEEALMKAASELPDLIVLDLMLPGINGLEVTKLLKNNSKTGLIPIIMLTAKGEDSDIITGLELGADDYITKPFSPKVIAARIKAVLRRKTRKDPEDMNIITIHDLIIHPGHREVLVNGKQIHLTFTEFGIFHYLAQRPGWVFTRAQIVDSVKGEDYFVTDRSVDVQIAGLRKKLGSAGKYIETVRGVGYRFREQGRLKVEG
ncbi:MAG: DNA-binding response regulator [Desulfobacteraceae bacterium 4484_190.1]|nr:response regulator transcription factor [Deltaproteobacteria bacterium]OPX38849.1 MAG: DNA-binding response regulator [Desulfobacteraceae bacterium 4484_190.1]